MKHILILWLFAGLVISGCQKDIDDVSIPPPTNPPEPTGPSAADLVKDTAYLYAEEIYLWNTQLPSNFNPRTYADPNKIMEAIRPYSMEPGFTTPVDRWSFGVLRSEWENVSGGIAADLGMGIFFRTNTDLRVTYVEKEGAAAKAGVERSWRITGINGNNTINTTDASINFIVDAIYGGDPATIEFTKPDATTTTLTLNPVTYQEYPLAVDTVYENSGKKVGYMVLNSFLGNTSQISTAFQNTFDEFASENVTDLIVDLRYNGGGYVSLWEDLANYLVPAASNGQVMYTESFNDLYSDWDTSIFFIKKGNLELNNIVFIISQNTASASEGVINSMLPHVNVKLVGPSESNGKPVGYFGIPTGDWLVFPVSFRTVNSANQGSFFNGFVPESQVEDGLDKPWGDLTEDCLASAMKFLTTGAFRSAPRETPRISQEFMDSYRKLPNKKKWNAAIENRRNVNERLRR